MAQHTTLIITHRLARLEDVDAILVLDRGRVVEQGRHHELLMLGGRYRHMWEEQRAGVKFHSLSVAKAAMRMDTHNLTRFSIEPPQ